MSGTGTPAPITAPLAGSASLSINGEAWSVVSDLEYMPSGSKQETLKGQTAVEGFSSMPAEGYVSATLRDRPDRKMSDFRVEGARFTVIGVLANGKVVTCTAGWVTELGALKTAEGTFDLHIESGDVTEDTV